MEFLDFAKSRYSCRSFADKPVEKEKILKILEAGRVAPTAVNFQPQRILVLTEKQELEKLSNCTRFGWNAPVVFIICYDKDVSWHRTFDGHDEGTTDASIVTTHMMFEAHSLGLGSTQVGAFNAEKTREVYNIPDNYEIVAMLPVGYPSDSAKPSDAHFIRKPLEETVFWNKF